MLPRLLSLLVVAAACSGCFLFPDTDYSPPIEQPMATEGAAEEAWSLEVGQGESAYAPLEDGAHVSKVHGVQGGYHVFVAALLAGPSVFETLTPKESSSKYAFANVEVEVVAGTKLVSRSRSLVAAKEIDEGRVAFTSLYAYVDEGLRGDVTINVKVMSDDETRWAAASRQVFVDD